MSSPRKAPDLNSPKSIYQHLRIQIPSPRPVSPMKERKHNHPCTTVLHPTKKTAEPRVFTFSAQHQAMFLHQSKEREVFKLKTQLLHGNIGRLFYQISLNERVKVKETAAEITKIIRENPCFNETYFRKTIILTTKDSLTLEKVYTTIKEIFNHLAEEKRALLKRP